MFKCNTCKITSLPVEILKIKNSLRIDTSSYSLDDLSLDTEILIFSNLDKELTNLPAGLKEIWIKKINKNLNFNHKLPFGCVIKYF